MRWEKYIDAKEVSRAIAVLQAPGKVFEVRAIGTAKKDILSGYFRDAETLLREFDTIDMRSRNIYITLGEVKDECFARAQSERFLKSLQTTSDTEIVRYRWLFVDLDPVRTAGVSSSDEELMYAKELSVKVCEYLQSMGFQEPVKAMSGNGYHLLYRIDVANDAAGRALVEKCLKVLAEMFDTDLVKIDTTNSNPSRICKLHGTLAQKGTSMQTRPHRMSRILSVPDEVKVTDASILSNLAGELPDTTPADITRRADIPQEFNLLDFMSRNGMTYEEDSNDRAKIYKLDECPFDPNHKNGDAKIFLYHDGKIAFKCHHNSCRGYKWQDVRLRFEPDAYDHKMDDERIDAGYQEHLRRKAEEEAKEPPKPKKENLTKKIIRHLKKAASILKKDLPETRVYIGVGEEIPLLTEGTCILSAKPKLGKSWLALAICIAIARGDLFLGYKTRKCSTLYLDLETSEPLQQRRLKKILHGEPIPENFYMDTETNTLENGFVEQIEAYLKEDPNIGVVVIDVFQIIRSSAKSMKETEYEHAYRDITPLNELAQKHHLAIILVCHDRKAVDPDEPFSNILGSIGLQGAVTQMMVMYRKRKEDPIHISIKGKTIDGQPELDVKLEDARWSVVEGVNTAERERARLRDEYQNSQIRAAVLKIADKWNPWKGRASTILQDSVELDVPIVDSAKEVGGFLHRHQGRFLAEDGVKIRIIDNGTGGKIYEIHKTTVDTVDTVDEKGEATVDGFQKVKPGNDLEIPFL